ncbi:MAG: hypothetical protein LIO60_01205, partial [Oscillospiraceae bacterium]|nr:hypothetical protein [Oscillospiraceae bacterium]
MAKSIDELLFEKVMKLPNSLRSQMQGGRGKGPGFGGPQGGPPQGRPGFGGPQGGPPQGGPGF